MNNNLFNNKSTKTLSDLPSEIVEIIEYYSNGKNSYKCNLTEADITQLLDYIEDFKRLKALKLTDTKVYQENKDGVFQNAVKLLTKYGANEVELLSLFPARNATDIRIKIVEIFSKYGNNKTEQRYSIELGHDIASQITEYEGKMNRKNDTYQQREQESKELKNKLYDEHIEDIHSDDISFYKLTKKPVN
jgi:hypothetical protein